MELVSHCLVQTQESPRPSGRRVVGGATAFATHCLPTIVSLGPRARTRQPGKKNRRQTVVVRSQCGKWTSKSRVDR